MSGEKSWVVVCCERNVVVLKKHGMGWNSWYIRWRSIQNIKGKCKFCGFNTPPILGYPNCATLSPMTSVFKVFNNFLCHFLVELVLGQALALLL